MATSAFSDHPAPLKRLFGRERPLHAAFGKGKVADILLWKNKKLSAAILAGFTAIWILFEVVEYSFITLLCHICILAMLILLIWTNWAGLIKWAPPDINDITISEHTFRWLYSNSNKLLLKLYDISSGRDMTTFFSAIGLLWILSVVGNYFSTLNILYVGFLALATIPALYERYEEEVDYLAYRGSKDMKKMYMKFDSNVLNKIPRGPVKEKKKF